MKKSTKILLIIFIVTLLPGIIFGKSIINGISVVENKFAFNFDLGAIVGLVFIGINIILGMILFFRFLASLPLDKVLFFSTVPLVLIYGILLFFLAYLNSLDNDFSKTIRSILNITENNLYNLILWVIIISLIFAFLLFVNYYFICRPVAKIERVVSRLGDGVVKEGKFNIGGGKHFLVIEHGLNKINNSYKDSDGDLAWNSLNRKNKLPKQFFRIIGRSGVVDLENGNEIKKHVVLMGIKILKSADFQQNSLEENFNIMSSYFNLISPIIRRYGGYIENYIGEGVVAVFGKNENAIECEHRICKAIELKNKKHGLLPKISVRISLIADNVVFGIQEINGRKIPTILSSKNLLDSVDEIGKFMSIKVVFSKNIIDNLPLNYRFKYRYIGSISTKDKGTLLFEDLDVYSRETRERLFRTKGIFEKGVLEYEKQAYKDSLAYFEQSLKEFSSDKASYIYYNKAKEKI